MSENLILTNSKAFAIRIVNLYKYLSSEKNDTFYQTSASRCLKDRANNIGCGCSIKENSLQK